MICKRCGNIIDGKHECSSEESIISEQTKISEDDSVQMQDMLLWLLRPEDKEKMTREEIVVVGFGIVIAVFLVGITIMNAILWID